ncbi:hypothetical protein SAMN00808754_2695 [Thermanaeromonas toyohensis ToBE]|uniref:Uncharacterized protein n=1 Tax=Thermanaeromonas toyohensis ToBE TaxID=698762 RepID=A0A1W1W1R1_9FIRM|nr:hypothetical protein SAMN00808754_2695 [Thermanaeromonas toyohensis ToBE]
MVTLKVFAHDNIELLRNIEPILDPLHLIRTIIFLRVFISGKGYV